MNTFQLKIIASNRTFFDGEAQQLIVPLVDGGSQGFLARHENCVVPIDSGEMRITDEYVKVIPAYLGKGFLEFLDNTAILVCISAELPEEIDARRAQEAKERAEEDMRFNQSQLEYYHSQANLARAMDRLKIKSRHNI